MTIRNVWKRVVAASVVWLVVGTATLAQQPVAVAPTDAAPKGDVERGKHYYMTYGCYMCHSIEGQGGAAPKLGPDPMGFRAFVRYVRAPRGTMPPYTEKLLPNEQDLADIHAYLRARPGPAPLSVLPPP